MSDAGLVSLCAAGWALVALSAAFRLRPHRACRRLREQLSPPRRHRARRTRPRAEDVGAWVLGRVGRCPTSLTAHRVGSVVITAAVAAPLVPSLPLLVPVALGLAWLAPGARLLREERRRLDRVRDDLPEIVDLLALAVSAGLNVRLAIEAVARRATGPLAAELVSALLECSAGRRLADALEDIPERAGEPVRPLVRALVSSERYGAPLSDALERLAGEVRADRRRRAEAAARRVPVKLLFPLVSCTLPAFGLLTVAPLIAGALRSLRPY